MIGVMISDDMEHETQLWQLFLPRVRCPKTRSPRRYLPERSCSVPPCRE